MALEPSRITDFHVGGPIGSGSTSKVFDAVHIATGTPVAIKMLEPSARGMTELRERFAREALMLSGLQSRHVGRLIGFGFEQGQPFLVLERLFGETLDARLRATGTIPIPTLVEWVEHILLGVRDCHAINLIHRDIKPGNIFLDRSEGVELAKLIDFGVARLQEIASQGASLTSTNHLLGSMGYMAPEQFKYARGVGPTADLYAVGVVIFRCFTGRLPFVSKSLEAVIRMKCESDPPALSSMPGMFRHDALDEFIASALAREPERRFQSAREMLEAWWRVSSTLPATGPLDVVDGISIQVEEALDESHNTLRETEAGAAGAEAAPRSTTAKIHAPIDPPTTPLEFTPVGIGQPVEFDQPTVINSNLKALIKQELELSRRRREGGGEE
jgi:serine/threonine-protein kinase